jgi:hypothetical protein
MKRTLLLFIFLAGCGYAPVSESPYVSTEDMRFFINAEDSGNDAKIAIRIGSPIGVLRVTGDDELRARVDGNAVPLVFTPGTASSYDAALGAINTNVVIDLDRSEHRDFRDVTVTMPATFTPTAPDPVDNDPIVITWDPAPPDANAALSMAVDIQGECIPPFQRTLDGDTGSATIDQADLQRVAQFTPCLLSVKVSRTTTSTGSLLDLTPGGSFNATMIRHRQIMVTLPP